MPGVNPYASDADTGAVYAAGRDRLCELAGALDTAAASTAVPACPAWTVKDVYAHVVGISADVVAGRVESLGSDAWTAAQVGARRDATLAEVCAEWAGLGPAIDALTAADPFLGLRLNADLVTHEHDIAAALGRAADRAGDAVRLGLVRYVPTFLDRVAAAGLAPVVVRCGARVWGAEPGAVAVEGSALDLLRSVSGRRTLHQVRTQLRWQGDPGPYLPLISAYGLPDTPTE
jgi:uncharacterized protein (TIGR03083 family)